MEGKVVGGNDVLVKVLPQEVKHLHNDEIVIVSRSRLNAELAFMEMKMENDAVNERIQIIKYALSDMIAQEIQQKIFARGAKMKVRDVKKIFPNLEDMPSNTFAQVKA